MLIPFGKNVLVEPLKPEQTTPSGIVIPDAAQTEQNFGKIVAAGKDSNLESGLVVLYSQYAGQPVTYRNQGLLLLSSDDILAYDDGAA